MKACFIVYGFLYIIYKISIMMTNKKIFNFAYVKYFLKYSCYGAMVQITGLHI